MSFAMTNLGWLLGLLKKFIYFLGEISKVYVMHFGKP